MDTIDDLPESDSSDEDYVPTGAGVTPGEIPSEVDSDGDPEDPLSESEDVGKRGQKRKRTSKTKRASKAKESPESSPEKVELTEEDKKKRADSLWDCFKKDTGFKKKLTSSEETTKTETKLPEPIKKKQPEKVTVTQVFEFAGEEVKIEKEVMADSAEARLLSESAGSSKSAAPSRKARGGLGGIGSVLSKIGKKQKLSTLEKTALDWNKFKKEEKIEDELERYKKGKDGYLERQDFLERADLRTFEIEKEVRTIERNKRMNNV